MQAILTNTAPLVHRRFHTPDVSILVSSGCALILALSGTFIYAVKVTVITKVIVYASTCIALPILRRRAGVARAEREATSFVAPAGIPVSILCVILCVWLLASSGWREARDVSIAIVIGLIIYAITRLLQRPSHT